MEDYLMKFFIIFTLCNLSFAANVTNLETQYFINKRAANCVLERYNGTVVECAAICSLHWTSPMCVAVKKTGYKTCELCFACADGADNLEDQVLLRGFRPLQEEMQKGLAVHLKMDEIINKETPAFGTRAVLKGPIGANVTSGQYNGSLLVPNVGLRDGNIIDLGTLYNTCTDNFVLCEQGHTLTIWIKISPQQPYAYPYIISTSNYNCYLDTTLTTHSTLHCYIYDFTGNKFWRAHVIHQLNYDSWILLGITFNRNQNSHKIFLNGCEMPSVKMDSFPHAPQTFTLGCRFGTSCARIYYDDLRIWNEEKPSIFMNQLYNGL